MLKRIIRDFLKAICIVGFLAIWGSLGAYEIDAITFLQMCKQIAWAMLVIAGALSLYGYTYDYLTEDDYLTREDYIRARRSRKRRRR